jgi:hypothetical protein
MLITTYSILFSNYYLSILLYAKVQTNYKQRIVVFRTKQPFLASQ